VRAWRDALRAAGADVRVVSSNALAGARDAAVLVVPSSPCLTIATREAIAAATARGQGVVITGAAGTHDAGCRPIGWGLVTQLTGASRVEPVERRGMVYVTLPAAGPLAIGLPPGARLDLDPAGQVALRLAGRDGYYSGYTLLPEPAAGLALVDAAVVHASVGRGRVVYWGFELEDVAETPWNRALVRLLLRNSVAWAAGTPQAAADAWPAGRRAAAVIAHDVEHQFTNVRHALDSLRDIGVRTTFYLTSNIATDNQRLTRALAGIGEIGTHSEDHRLLGGTPPDSQRARLAVTQRELAELLGDSVRGLRPPEEQFDRATMAAWLEAGGTYVFGANNARVAAPELLAIDGDTIVLLGRVNADDFVMTGPDAPRGGAALAATFLGEFANVRALGGLYILSYHSQLLSQPEHVPVLARVVRGIAADSGTWVATAGDVADWWRARAALGVRLTAERGGRLRLVVRNAGPRLVHDAVVRVVLPPRTRVVRADALLLEAPAGFARVAMPPLPAGAARTVVLVTSSP
jgi:peptidoglycan/xylan/chitin deacetylase (PgdA/CDA1 family)